MIFLADADREGVLLGHGGIRDQTGAVSQKGTPHTARDQYGGQKGRRAYGGTPIQTRRVTVIF